MGACFCPVRTRPDRDTCLAPPRAPFWIATDEPAFFDALFFTALMMPAAQGFASFAGTVRLELGLEYGGQPGFMYFDLAYSPEQAATWLPGVREAQTAASLDFFVKAQVLLPGRYVVSARVDDANGVPFALLQFNEALSAGTREVRLQTFGALIRDKQPVFPLKLRDVDGFLLIPDKFPDRATLARLPGVVHVSARYALDRFSPAEWTSEERERYLTEYGKDAETARNQVQELMGK